MDRPLENPTENPPVKATHHISKVVGMPERKD
jgi:hypothetical protein